MQTRARAGDPTEGKREGRRGAAGTRADTSGGGAHLSGEDEEGAAEELEEVPLAGSAWGDVSEKGT